MTPKVVAVGGGHGLSATLRALALLDVDVAALVSVADDGGSSGRLRDQFDVLPPGDLRMALSALAADSPIRRLVDHRFGGDGDMAGHSLGNLMLTALWQQEGVIDGLRTAARILQCRGEVLPVSLEPHHLVAEVTHPNGDIATLAGQASISRVAAAVHGVSTVPALVEASNEALAALGEADAIVLGPGSWFTSVIAPLLVRNIPAAITASNAPVALIVNLEAAEAVDSGAETPGYALADYLASLNDLTGIGPDAVLVDQADVLRLQIGAALARVPTLAGEDIQTDPSQTIFASPMRIPGTGIHDPKMLARTLRGWLSSLGL